MLRTLSALVLSIILPCAAAAAVVVEDYDLEHEIPEPKIIGPRLPEVVRAATEMRTAMIENLDYWRRRGLPNPVDLRDIYVFSDPKDLTILEMLETLNPGRVDDRGRYGVREHLARQRRILEESAFVRIANDLRHHDEDIREMFSREEMIDFVFDYYCFIRYGFAVTGTWKAIQEKKTFAEADPFVMMPQKDNAFYGKFPRIDLGDVLKPVEKAKARAKKNSFFDNVIALFGSVDLEAITKRAEDDPNQTFFSRRIVILPRTTEGESGTALDVVSSLHDFSIATHELGHHVNSSLAFRLGSMDRLFEEVFADWLSAAQSDNPKLGEHFAWASGEIARRLRTRPQLTREETQLLVAFDKIAAKGRLRDFEEPSTIQTLDRHVLFANPYDGGNPGRAFLSNLRGQLTPAERERFDEITLHVINQLGHLPKVTSTLVSFKLFFRKMAALRRQMKAVGEERRAIMTSGEPWVRWVLDRAEEEIKNSPEEMAKINELRGDWRKSKKDFERRMKRHALKIVTRDGLNIETLAKTRAGEKLRARELARRPRRTLFGLKDRPPIPADYALPEMFRAYFRVARAQAPELVDRIVAEAGRAMESEPHRMRLNGGEEELLFVRRKISVSWALAESDLRSALQTLADLRPRLLELKSRKPAPKEQVDELTKRYDRALERLQEFERTGSWLGMMYPSPAVQLGRDFVQRLSKLSESEKKALESCARILGAL